MTSNSKRKIVESDSDCEQEFDFDEEEKKQNSIEEEETVESKDFIDDDDVENGGSDDSYETDDSDSDSDSDGSYDVPLSSLVSKSQPSSKSSSPKSKSKTKTKTKTPVKKKKKVTKKKVKTSSSKTKKKSTKRKNQDDDFSSTDPNDGPRLASAELYSNCAKGKLIQALLCRWWYAYTWPDPNSVPEAPSKHYDALDGFPGVYVCTSGDEVGKIVDHRDKSTCPNFINFAKKTTEELKKLLLVAIETQKEALIKAEGEGTETEKDLNKLMNWVKKLNPTKTDKEAVKVLKAARIEIQV